MTQQKKEELESNAFYLSYGPGCYLRIDDRLDALVHLVRNLIDTLRVDE